MEEDTNIAVKPKKETFFAITATQIICVTVILVTLMVLKMFFPSLFNSTKKWCTEEFLSKTSVNEVLREDENYEI